MKRNRPDRGEMDALKRNLLANVSHELRTPLTPIIGFASLLREHDLDEETSRRALESIVDSSSRLERTIDNLVVTAEFAAGAVTMDRQPVAIDAIVRDVVERRRLAHAGPGIRVEFGDGTFDAIGDAHYLARAIDELLDNAIKFSPNDGPIAVRVTEIATHVAVSIRDHGIGVPLDAISVIFDNFTQLDSSATRRFGGMGLGLRLVAGVAEAHGGSVEVASLPDHGSCFTLIVAKTACRARTSTRWRAATGLTIAACVAVIGLLHAAGAAALPPRATPRLASPTLGTSATPVARARSSFVVATPVPAPPADRHLPMVRAFVDSHGAPAVTPSAEPGQEPLRALTLPRLPVPLPEFSLTALA